MFQFCAIFITFKWLPSCVSVTFRIWTIVVQSFLHIILSKLIPILYSAPPPWLLIFLLTSPVCTCYDWTSHFPEQKFHFPLYTYCHYSYQITVYTRKTACSYLHNTSTNSSRKKHPCMVDRSGYTIIRNAPYLKIEILPINIQYRYLYSTSYIHSLTTENQMLHSHTVPFKIYFNVYCTVLYFI